MLPHVLPILEPETKEPPYAGPFKVVTEDGRVVREGIASWEEADEHARLYDRQHPGFTSRIKDRFGRDVGGWRPLKD